MTIRALTHLEKRLNIKFNIQFPATFDIDAYMHQLDRNESESNAGFFERARLTYQLQLQLQRDQRV